MIELRSTKRFDEWLQALRDERARVRIVRRIDRLRFGNFGDAEPVGGGVSEMRVDYGPGYRVYFTQFGPTLVLLLCGGDKGSQSRDIARAKSLASEARTE